MRTKVLKAAVAVVSLLAVMAILGAAYGAVVGMRPYEPPFDRVTGMSGAILGVELFLAYGCPVAVIGIIAGWSYSSRNAKPAMTS